jgi:hypothetical protein
MESETGAEEAGPGRDAGVEGEWRRLHGRAKVASVGWSRSPPMGSGREAADPFGEGEDLG